MNYCRVFAGCRSGRLVEMFYLLVFFVFFATTLIVEAAAPVVSVPGLGTIRGSGYGALETFLGIPYAEPPVGDLRFLPPVPLTVGGGLNSTPMTEVYNATKLPVACSQHIDPSPSAMIKVSNEDCLYLNIWKPVSASPNNSKPVMVWLYGGSFTSGSSSMSVYDGSVLALRGDVLIVSMNYRVGPLGFLATDDSSAPGNVGLLDQQLALRWVHDHIAAFGGDPGRVTLFGESAGGASVSYHLMSAGSDPLFSNAIMESTVNTGPFVFIKKDDVIRNTKALADIVGCPTASMSSRQIVDCLREKNDSVLVAAQWEIPVSGPSTQNRFGPTVDGTFMTKPPIDVVNSRQFQRKNILLGVNNDEGAYFLFSEFPEDFNPATPNFVDVTATRYREMVGELTWFTPRQLDVAAFEYSTPATYAERRNFTYFSALDDVLGDVFFKCPLVNFSLSYAADIERSRLNSSVYVYEFRQRDPLNPRPAWTGQALHAGEITYVFGVPSNPYAASFYANEDRTLSNRIIEYWTNFAKSGDPNRNETGDVTTDTVWPRYTTTDRLVLVLDNSTTLQTQIGLRDRQCDFWTLVVPQLTCPAVTIPTYAPPPSGDGNRVRSQFSIRVVQLLLAYTGILLSSANF